MLFKEYLEELNKLAQENPKVLDYVVVSAADDEGNSYQIVSYAGTIGKFEGDYHGDFLTKEQYADEDDFDEDEFIENAICIN